jgi:hypothetical protein
MAVFAPLFDQLLSSVFKQISADYNLDYKEMMDRYTGKSSFAVYADHDQETIDLDKPVKESKKSAPKSKQMEEVKLMALSKMKKADLVSELEEQGIDTDGLNVAKLKELVKEAREKVGAKPAKKSKEPEPEPEVKSPKKKSKKSKKAKEPEPEPEPSPKKKSKKSKKAKEPEPEPEPELEEEAFDESEIEPVVDPVEFEEEEEDLEAANQEDLEARLRAIIAEANGDDEDESDEEVDPTDMTQVLEEEVESPGAVRARMLRK